MWRWTMVALVAGCGGLRSINPCPPGVDCLTDTDDTDPSGWSPDDTPADSEDTTEGEDTPDPPANPEDCDDRRDNDGDRDVDCDDADCEDVCDADGDGAVSVALRGDDCDDADENVYPGADEICDNVDNDCDGLTDDEDDVVGAPLWYLDSDRDGYGDPAQSQYLCRAGGLPVAAAAGDCNDSAANVNPAQAEVPCDGLNNDCSGATPDAGDADGDGANACTDCNDTNPNIAPGRPEVCGDGLDSNCDTLECDTVFQDGFETGSLANGWTTAGQAGWFATDNNQQHSGTWAAASGAIDDNRLSSMEITVTLPSSGTVTFWHKEDSERGFDFLEFLVDGTILGSWSGANPYAQASYTLAPGTHELKWRYEKDVSVDSGMDRVWVDDVRVTIGP